MWKLEKGMLKRNVMEALRAIIIIIILYFSYSLWNNYDYFMIPLEHYQMIPRFQPKRFHTWQRIHNMEQLRYGMVVYYEFPHRLAGTRRECLFFSRIAGLPGDRIGFKGGKLYRNGDLVEENYLDPQNASQENYPEIVVPRDSVYLLNDNRAKRGREIYYRDSRLWGPLSFYCLVSTVREE